MIDGEVSLSKTEKVFLGREAAISADAQEKYKLAETYYLYARKNAIESTNLDVLQLGIGLLVDAALVSWHMREHAKCLSHLSKVLGELEDNCPDSSLRAFHSHAVTGHVILWLNRVSSRDLKNLIAGEEETKVFPGMASIPEPNPEIRSMAIAPVDLLWYFLAAVENNCCLDVGISKLLNQRQSKGHILEGLLWLTPSRMNKAFRALDSNIFTEALGELISEHVFYTKSKRLESFDITQLTYGDYPAPTTEQQFAFCAQAEQYVLSFIAVSLFKENVSEMDALIRAVDGSSCFKVRSEFLAALHGNVKEMDFNIQMATSQLKHREMLVRNGEIHPQQIFEFAFYFLQLANQTKHCEFLLTYACDWLIKKWIYVCKNQRFLLANPLLVDLTFQEESDIMDKSRLTKLVEVLICILPTIGIQNELELKEVLDGFLNHKD